jgi:hypothetical protein
LYERSLYTRRIEPFIDKPVIKIITGMRRVGKSSLLLLLKDHLLNRGVPERNILFINKESLTHEHIQTHSNLNESFPYCRVFRIIMRKLFSQWTESGARMFRASGGKTSSILSWRKSCEAWNYDLTHIC